MNKKNNLFKSDECKDNTTCRHTLGFHDLCDGVYETDSIFQKGEGIANSTSKIHKFYRRASSITN